MDQGLRLLIQLILEFAPVIANVVQKRTEAHFAITPSQNLLPFEDFLQSSNGLDQSISYAEGVSLAKSQQVALLHYQTQLKIATQQRETAFKLPEIHKILDSWPLRLAPSQILESHVSYNRTPLKIFIAPPKVKFDRFEVQEEEISDIELILAEGFREFLHKNYSLHSSTRPTEFLAGAWDSKRFHSESSIKALFGILKTEPTLILESEVDGDYLNFRIAYWGLGQENYFYKTITRFPYKNIIYQSVKNRALEWKKIRDELILLGENLEEINNIGGDNVSNLAVIEKIEKWQKKGIDTSKLSLHYKVNRQDFEKLCQVLTTCHILAASWIADAYHLIHHDVPPLLPELLPGMLRESVDFQSVNMIATGYEQLYQALEVERHDWIPELTLQLAQSFCYLKEHSLAKQQLEHSIHTWLKLRQVPLNQEAHPLERMLSAIRVEDEEYVEKLREYFTVVGDRQSISYIEELLSAIANLKQRRRLEYAELTNTLTGHSGKVSSIAICSDGQTLATGCTDKTIKVWNLNTGKLIRTLTENLGEVSSVAVSPDGNLLAVGSHETPRSNVKVWNLTTGKLLHTLLGHQKPVNFVVISPDGKFLASGSNKIKIWNLYTGDRTCTLWHASSVNTAVISPDGNILISGSTDHKIRLWNPHTGDPLRTLNGHSASVKSLAISPNGEILVSGSADNIIKIWHLETGKVLQSLSGHSDQVKSVVVSPDGKTLFSASADKTIKIWRLYTGELLQTLTGHSSAVNCIAISPDGQFLVSGSSDKTIKIWHLS